MIAGNDPDFNRKNLYEAIEAGNYPEWELGVQLIPEEDEHKFDFDILDPTKIIPEEDVPVTMIGKFTLNKNVDNHFAETEQVAFHPGHLVPGIDFSNDPLLQGRLFSYTDTQLIRLGGPNYHELPINRPVNGFYNNQRDGSNRMPIREMNINKVLVNIDLELAQKVAVKIGVTPPTEGGNAYDKVSPTLSEESYPHLPDTRKVGVLISDGYNNMEVDQLLEAFTVSNVQYEIVSENQGKVKGINEKELEIDYNFDTTDAVLYDALYVAGGADLSKQFKKETNKFINKHFDHYKTIAASQKGTDILREAGMLDQPGVLSKESATDFSKEFIEAIAKDRHWERKV